MAKKKPYLQTMKSSQKVAQLCDPEKGEFQLKIGKNIIIVDGKRKKVVNYTGEDSQVQKDMQDETDIKNILQKYGRTGMLPIIKDEALYGDFSTVPDYQEAQNILIQANEQFNNLSSDLRKKFDNSPEEFLKFCTNKDNLEEMRELGLANKLEEREVVNVNVINQQKTGSEE